MLTGTLNRGVRSWPPIEILSSVVDRILNIFAPASQPISAQELIELPGGPRDCALVLDASPSMAETDWRPSRIAGAQAAALAFCQRLARDLPDARIALVAYGGAAKLLCPLTPAAMLQSLMVGIRRIDFINATNIASGVQVALDLLAATGRPGQVVLLSDGHNNTGPDPRPVAKALRRCAVIETVGIGGSPNAVDEPLLKEIASSYANGKKRYRWIGDPDGLVQHFHNLAGGITRS